MIQCLMSYLSALHHEAREARSGRVHMVLASMTRGDDVLIQCHPRCTRDDLVPHT
jgi:hypothetical protein